MSKASLEYYAKRGLLGEDAHDVAHSGDTKTFGEMFPRVPDELKYTPGSNLAPASLDEHSATGKEQDDQRIHPEEDDFFGDQYDSTLAKNTLKARLGQQVAANDSPAVNQAMVSRALGGDNSPQQPKIERQTGPEADKTDELIHKALEDRLKAAAAREAAPEE